MSTSKNVYSKKVLRLKTSTAIRSTRKMSTSKNVYSKKGLQLKLCSQQNLKNITDKSFFRFFTFLIVFHAFSSLEMNFSIPTESNF